MHYKSVLTATLCNLPILKNKDRNLSLKTLFSCHHDILESAGNVGSKYGLNCSRDAQPYPHPPFFHGYK